VLLWGLRDWWIRERQKGFLDEAVSKRADCPEGSGCGKQRDLAHAREFNHVIGPQPTELQPEKPAVSSEAEADTLLRQAIRTEASNVSILRDLVSSSSLAIPDSTPSSSQDFRDVVDALT